MAQSRGSPFGSAPAAMSLLGCYLRWGGGLCVLHPIKCPRTPGVPAVGWQGVANGSAGARWGWVLETTPRSCLLSRGVCWHRTPSLADAGSRRSTASPYRPRHPANTTVPNAPPGSGSVQAGAGSVPKGTTELPQRLDLLLNSLYSFFSFFFPLLPGLWSQPPAVSPCLSLPGCCCRHRTAAPSDHQLHCIDFNRSVAPAPPSARHGHPGPPQQLPRSGAFPCTPRDGYQGKQGSCDGRDPVSGPCPKVRRHLLRWWWGVTTPALCLSPHTRARGSARPGNDHRPWAFPERPGAGEEGLG